MNIRKVSSIAVTMAALLMVCSPAFAHHGTGSSYDSSKTVSISGVVDEFIWANPHSQLYVNVTDAQGNVVRWGVEMNSPGVLARAGWTRRKLKAGDKVTVTVHPSLAGTPVGVFRSIVFPDGTTFGATGNQQTNTN
jgi:Family of unknown function (DUF6152)